MNTGKEGGGFTPNRRPTAGSTQTALAGRYLERQKLLDCRVRRAWPQVIHIWEPLPTKAPGPHLAAPLFCYLRTVIFYVWPYVQFSRRRGFAEWDRVETMICQGDQISFDGLFWEACGGSVVWKGGRWWMRRNAQKNSRRAREWNGLEW